MMVGRVLCKDEFAPSDDTWRQKLATVQGVTVVPTLYASSTGTLRYEPKQMMQKGSKNRNYVY
jgi:hypothetical protein